MLKALIATIFLFVSIKSLAAPLYDPSQFYQGGSIVEYNGQVYKAKWWVGAGDVPEINNSKPWQTPWEWIGEVEPPVEVTGPTDIAETRIGPEITSSVTEHFRYYLIDPDTPDDIRHELNNDSTVPMHGRTDYNVAWNYEYLRDNGICSIKKAEVKVTTHYVMPRLSLRSSANIDTKNKFDAYYSKLMQHEKNHHGFGMEAAKEIEQLIFSWEPESCQTIGNSINREAYQILARHGEKNEVYDNETNHGYTEGVIIE